MASIVLATINAKYPHTAFGLRYLHANLGTLSDDACLIELTTRERAVDMAEKILAKSPQIVGIGVYIWNATLSLELVSVLKRVHPELVVVLGGPEVSHETDRQAIAAIADYTICGEGEEAFRGLCEQLLGGDRPVERTIIAPPPELRKLALPYALYDDDDIAHRVIYAEVSRGCPYTCTFCLSALDATVRAFALDDFFAAMDRLIARGVRRFKLVDRTFNLSSTRSRAVLDFFAQRYVPGMFLHVEVVPKQLAPEVVTAIAAFAPGTLQLEIGVQTFDPAVAQRIGRRQSNDEVRGTLRQLRAETEAHVHTDLIVGLPGESLSGFAAGFDQLVALGPQEIQVGILKRLRGAPICNVDPEFQMTYHAAPPYEILSTAAVDFKTMQRLKRFARVWDLVGNRGNFREATPLLWCQSTPFCGVMTFADWLFKSAGRVHNIALDRLTRLLHDHLVEHRGLPPQDVIATLYRDYTRSGRSKVPNWLRTENPQTQRPTSQNLPPRQARHL